MIPPDGDRDGETFSRPRDRDRLNRQARAVFRVMADKEWHTLPEISERTGEPEASISARLRDLRKPRFGGHTVEKRHVGNGLWEYQWQGRAASSGPQPHIGAMFAGYGGLDLAVMSVIGGSVHWYAENAPGPAAVMAHHYPDVPNIGDVTEVDWSTVPPVDVITGGTPCQDLSHAGPRGGMTEGTRSNLWVAMREAIAVIRPGLVVWENVRGAYSAKATSNVEPCPGCVGDGPDRHLRAYGRVAGDLAALGYDCEWTAIRAADIGAPHDRFRTFLVAYAESVPF